MKNLFLMLVFVFVTSLTFATNHADLILNESNHYSLVEQAEVQHSIVTEDNDVTVSFIVDKTNGEGGCEIKGNLTITTESGNSVTVSFAVTASTCKEAIAVANQMMAALG